jgi:hypothetical protein
MRTLPSNNVPSASKSEYPNITLITTAKTSDIKPELSLRKACHIRPAQFADHARISALEARYSLATKTYEEWTHLWMGNPSHQRLEKWDIGWVVENEHGEILGHIANIPSNFEFEGRTLLAASGSGLVVDERYRSYAMPLFGQFVNQPLPDLIVNNSVNAQGLALHTLFHFQRVPTGGWGTSDFWITEYSGFAEKLAESKGWPRALSYPAGAGLRIHDAFYSRPQESLPAGLRIDTISQFDSRFDDFWQQLRATSHTSLMAVRSRDTLDWHFKFPLARGAAWVSTISKGSQLVAFGVFLRQDSAEVELRRFRLVDFQALDGNLNLLSPMLASALRRCRDEKVHMLEAIGFSPAKRKIISALAPHRRELPCWLYFYKSKNKNDGIQLAQKLKEPAAWDPSPFDGDGSL